MACKYFINEKCSLGGCEKDPNFETRCPSGEAKPQASELTETDRKDIADKIITFLIYPAQQHKDITNIPVSFWNEVINTIDNIIASKIQGERERIMRRLPEEKEIEAFILNSYDSNLVKMCMKLIGKVKSAITDEKEEG